MTPKTPREALETIDTIYNGNGGERGLSSRECERILTALAPYLVRTPGTFEVCELCGRAASLLNKMGCGKLYDIHGERECPIKQVTNEKA